MAYDTPKPESYSIALTDLTVGTTRALKGPAGKRGYLVDVLFSCQTATAGATSTPRIQVGKAGDLARSADFNVGAMAANVAKRASDVPNALKGVAQGRQPVIETDEQVLVTVVAASGAGAAGAGHATVIIEWF